MKASEVEKVLAQLLEVREEIEAMERSLPPVEGGNAASGRNLLHYVGLRRHDLRSLQRALASLGLSSLGRAEPAVLDSIDAVIRLVRIIERAIKSGEKLPAAIPLDRGQALLDRNTAALLGPRPKHRHVRIMVTMPTEAAHEPGLIKELLGRGMDCMRVNCARDDETEWAQMIAHLGRARTELDRPCRVLMDLPGPKLRTGALLPGPPVLKIRPQRDALGRVERPVNVWLTADERRTPAPPGLDVMLPLAGGPGWLSVGQAVDFIDARGAKRRLVVAQQLPGGFVASCDRTSYLTSGTELYPSNPQPGNPPLRVGTLPPVETALLLHKGDKLILTRDASPGQLAVHDAQDKEISPAKISCSLPEAFADVRPGQSIWLDDGKMGGRIDSVSPMEIAVTMTQTAEQGSKLRGDKGINLPDTDLHLPALTPADLEVLPFVAKHADIVGYSFVRRPADVLELQGRLASLGASELGIILKIETRQAFEHLPDLLLAAMRSRVTGAMIARGDLAIECGYQRLAEIQEEILWMCEAAHSPVIWATQVLENLAKGGIPSRAEITDAAMGERAECVMLNKGPYIVEATRALDDILRRMEAHQDKKRSMLRELHVADRFGELPG